MRLRPLLSVLFVLSLGLVARADTFSYTLNGGSSGFSGVGMLTGTSVSPGIYQITGITGTGVTGLINRGAFNGNDILFYTPGSPNFDGFGLGFTDQNASGSYRVDLYASGANYYAFVTDSDNFSATVPVQFSAAQAVTPEPSSLALLGTGILGVYGVARRRFFSRG